VKGCLKINSGSHFVSIPIPQNYKSLISGRCISHVRSGSSKFLESGFRCCAVSNEWSDNVKEYIFTLFINNSCVHRSTFWSATNSSGWHSSVAAIF
jgi:hypothetical protein